MDREAMSNIICYCFNYTEQDILDDLRKNCGSSSLLQGIVAEKREGNCRCRETNPAGR